MDVAWEDKEQNLDYVESRLQKLEAGQIVVLPEMFSTGFSMNTGELAETMEGSTVERMKSLAKEYKLIITGSLIIEDAGKYYNRMLWVQPDGVVHHYDKRHLFTLAEESQHYSAGQERVIAQVGGWKILLQVCFDLRFPVWQRNVEDYDAMIVVGNWPESRILAWEKLLMARAIENQCFVLAVNRIGIDPSTKYSGKSMLINPLGEQVQTADNREEILLSEIHGQDLEKVRSQFPFLSSRDSFILER